MKPYLYIIIFIVLALTSENSQAQNFKFANTFEGKSSTYGIYGNNVFKLDSSGNSIWVKDFSGNIATTLYPNRLTGSAFDGNFLYIAEAQGSNSSSTPSDFYPAIIKMDTLGNIISIMSSTINSIFEYNLFDIYPSYRGGIWILEDRVTGTTQRSYLSYMDSTGHVTSARGFWYNSRAYMSDFTILPDSGSIVCVNHYTNIFPASGFPALMKFNNTGSEIWRANYSIINSNYSLLQERKLATDNSGNIYLICDYYSPAQVMVALKLNRYGDILLSKLFPDLPGNSIQDLNFKNGNLVCRINNNEIFLDTLLNNPCINSQNFSVRRLDNYIGSFISPQYAMVNFSPTIGQSLNWTAAVYPDYCASINIDDIDDEILQIKIYPIPSENDLYIETIAVNYSISLFNIEGRVYFQNTNSGNVKIDLSEIHSGIYILKVQGNNFSINKKVIVF